MSVHLDNKIRSEIQRRLAMSPSSTSARHGGSTASRRKQAHRRQFSDPKMMSSLVDDNLSKELNRVSLFIRVFFCLDYLDDNLRKELNRVSWSTVILGKELSKLVDGNLMEELSELVDGNLRKELNRVSWTTITRVKS